MSASGGSTITISGTGFQSDQRYECVDNDGVSTMATVISTDVILCDVPALKLGRFQIHIVTSGVLNFGYSSIGHLQLSYANGFKILSASPCEIM